MPRWMRALLIAAAATGVAALALDLLPGWKEPPPAGGSPQRSKEDVIDELSDTEKEQMLRELGQHV